ncbi:SRPBCC domain-containing protein [Tunicatimonas pelagia]|uniref:SRPBCC domain-containing protein n=1 Tax=Tunicatimonas pelagia TaxID=931531 RepID=UPI002666F1A1|nr:SRPBCC domain-containing protein [Tunicatimonas pelagia]WKN44513.1 SRPBCC domain-containing protein [Tunicatimonas pelagia]
MARKISLFFIIASFLSSCYSLEKSVEASLPYSEEINWPKTYKPTEAKFFVHNEIEIEASPDVVWNILVQAEAWPEWYEGASEVNVQNTTSGILTERAIFTWQTMGLNFTSSIREFVPPYRLSWESEKKSITGYHAWLIVPTDTGCQLITSESQRGWLTFFEKTFQPKKLRRLHDVWLAAIKEKAENNN